VETHIHKISCLDCRLGELCLPYGLKKEDISQLSSIVKTKRPIRLDEYLYRQGEHSQSLFAVKSGSFRSFISSLDGIEQTLGFYLPGELMGLDSLQTGEFTCSVVALETATVCELPLPRLSELANKIPGLQSQLMRIIGKEIASDHDKIVLGHRTAKEKISSFLLMLSRRYHALGFSGTEFNLTMPRHDIANFLGLTIETVSRQMADLTKTGIISINQRQVQINNLDTLKAIVEPCLSNHARAAPRAK
jgi:CRP/FNR family transcriptional regulator, anaerobic regulatory protein